MSEYASTEQILGELASAPAQEPSAPQASGEVAPPSPEASGAPPEPKMWEVPWNGRTIKAGEQDLVKWASQGYDYSQKMSQLSQERQEIESRYKPFQEIDDFARKNPEWWSHVEQSWSQRDQIQQQNLVQKLPEEFRPAIESLLKETQAMKAFQADWHREKMEAEQRDLDAKLLNTVQGLQSKHNIDFSSRDESGQTLEYRVLDFAKQHGIADFEVAFNAYYQPMWARHYEMQGREAAVREMQKQRESGLLAKAPAPSSQPQRPARNWNEAAQNALAELGLG